MSVKKLDHRSQYWYEAIEAALSDFPAMWSAWQALPEENRQSITWSIEGSVENHGQAFGYDAIPHPLKAELREAQLRHEIERKREAGYTAERIENYKRGVQDRDDLIWKLNETLRKEREERR